MAGRSLATAAERLAPTSGVADLWSVTSSDGDLRRCDGLTASGRNCGRDRQICLSSASCCFPSRINRSKNGLLFLGALKPLLRGV